MKFRTKMTLCMLGLLSLLFGAGGSLLISLSFHNSLEHEKDVAFSAYQMVLGTFQIVNDMDRQWDYEDMINILRQFDEQNESAWAGLRLSARDGVLYESGAAAVELGKGGARAEAGTCMAGYAAGAGGRRYLILTGAVAVSEDVLHLRAARDITSLYETRTAHQQIFRWVFTAMAFLCAALAYTVSRILTAPLEGLSRASRAIASGQYSSRVRVRSGDEIGAVSADFNAMAERLEETVTELQDAVARQERFMGSFAHELKTPMTSIIGYSDLLRGGTLTREEQADAVGYIFSEGKRLESLSCKLLELLVITDGAPPLVPACPADLIWGLTEQLAPVYAREGVRLDCSCASGVCLLEPDLVRSLLLNLVDNARKAMDGGRITIRSEMLSDGCRIQVLDNGRGIPPEALGRLTEAFYRVDRSRSREQGGVGLGLTLCRSIAALHHGGLRFENRKEGGVCVTAELRGGRP